MQPILSRAVYYEELTEKAQEDIFNDIVSEIKKELAEEFASAEGWNVKIKELYFFTTDEEVNQFVNNLASARLVENFEGQIYY